MTSILQNEYHPNSVSVPGETLLETLNALGMSQAELAMRMTRPVKTINEIIQGKTIITAETALQLEQVLRVPASFWLKREQIYRESLARIAEEEKLESWQEWLNELPIQQLIQRGWIPDCADKTQQVAELLKFFAVSSPGAWHEVWDNKVVAYRKAAVPKAHFGSITTWLRKGEIEAQEIVCLPYSTDEFQASLKSILTLTVKPVSLFQPELVRLCAKAGVAVVFVPELPNTGISGATQWITSNKALIQLSLRYKTDDHLWFTFFHEAGHILLHGKRLIFLEAENVADEISEKEQEADNFARNFLIEQVRWKKFIAGKSYRSKTGIRKFAHEIKIAPGIIVGRLQHERLLHYHYCNDLKSHLTWNKE